ncbi:MAG: PilZ domain-containing protein [Pseudomonadota bacterium]
MLSPKFKRPHSPKGYTQRTERYTAKAWVLVRQLGSDPFQMKLENVSKTGCKLQCLASLDQQKVISIEAANCPRITAHIVWSNAGSYGCKFEVPLSDDVIALLTA